MTDRFKQISLILQSLGSIVNTTLETTAQEKVPWIVICALDGVAQYISNTERAEGVKLIKLLLSRWEEGRADIPAHYNPDLARVQEPTTWHPMESAPLDGTSVQLLIEGGEHPLSDDNPSVSIGSFGVDGWDFAGWSWHQDCYCRGTGTPIGWLPTGSPIAAPPTPAAVPPSMALVPIEPTPEMLRAAHDVFGNSLSKRCYAQMIAAARAGS